MEDHVIIIGAGIAGLAAARELAGRRRVITILEGRQRIGGRIHTIMSTTGEIPIEVGAEFVHGAQNDTWQYLRSAHLRTEEVPDRHWTIRDGEWRENGQFWNQLAQTFDRINTATPDQHLQSFLDEAWSLSPSAKFLIKEFVEGFHAADAERISIHALAQAEAAAEREQGTRQFRVASGYSRLLHWIWDQLERRDVHLHFGTVAKVVRWDPGQVEVIASTEAGEVAFRGRCLICTVPLAVLQNETGAASIRFEPAVPKEKAIHQLAMGQVCKITMQFKERFWPIDDFGFIHSADRSFPTWWALPYGQGLTGWAGGPRARGLNTEPQETVLAEAIRALAVLFKREPQQVEDSLSSAYFHNWQSDPFSLGAYSYIPAHMLELPGQLAAPVSETLFFAGEATDREGAQGTVHGALRSGLRAAAEVKQVLRNRRLFATPSIPQQKAA